MCIPSPSFFPPSLRSPSFPPPSLPPRFGLRKAPPTPAIAYVSTRHSIAKARQCVRKKRESTPLVSNISSGRVYRSYRTWHSSTGHRIATHSTMSVPSTPERIRSVYTLSCGGRQPPFYLLHLYDLVQHTRPQYRAAPIEYDLALPRAV
eukprot:562153-Rhodomonas_salina.1